MQDSTSELDALPHRILYSLDDVPEEVTPAERLYAGKPITLIEACTA